MRELQDVAAAFHRASDTAGVPYAFIGGLAVMAWGQPRMTMDVGSLSSWRKDQAEEFSRALHAEGLHVALDDLLDAPEDGSLTVFDADGIFHVDVKPARTPDETDELGNARLVHVDGAPLRIAAPEETIAFKLAFGNPQDIQDARSILVRQAGALDTTRLEQVAARLGIRPALDQMRSETGNG